MSTKPSRSFAPAVNAGSWIIRTVLLLVSLSLITTAQVTVTTQHNDNYRSGQNPRETILTPSTVASNQFGKLFSYAVDGDVHAQPLYKPQVAIPGRGIHNVLYVATARGSVYAFDADSNTGDNSLPLWHVNLVGATQRASSIGNNSAAQVPMRSVSAVRRSSTATLCMSW